MKLMPIILRTIYIMVVSTDTYKSVFREIEIAESEKDPVKSLKILLKNRVQTDEEVIGLLQTGQNISFAQLPETAVAIRGLHCYAAICGLSSDMNYEFLTEIMMEARELTEEMKSKNQMLVMTEVF